LQFSLLLWGAWLIGKGPTREKVRHVEWRGESDHKGVHLWS